MHRVLSAALTAVIFFAPVRALCAGSPRYLPLTTAQLYAPGLRFEGTVPMVSIGLETGQSVLELELEGGPVRVSFDEDQLPKSRWVMPGTRLVFRAIPGRSAERRFWARVASLKPGARASALEAAKRFRRSGRVVSVVESGALFALDGVVLDTRRLEVLVGGGDRDAALALSAQFFENKSLRAPVRSTLVAPPEGYVSWVDPAGEAHRISGRVHLGLADGAELRLGGRRYRGHLYVVPGPEARLALVQSVDVESMLRGIVPAEIFSSAPPAALEAQALVARGAVLSLLAHRHFDEPFHLCDEQHCQVYKGAGAHHPATDKAVSATRGKLVLRPSRQGRVELVESVYSASCGGHTESNEVVWDQAPSPSLRPRLDAPPGDPALAAFRDGLDAGDLEAWLGGFPPTYCARSRFTKAERFRWQRRFERSELDAIGAQVGVGPLRKLEVLGRGPGGRVRGIRVIGTRGRVDVLRELPVRRLLGNLRSGAFLLRSTVEGDRLVHLAVHGGGFGHGVGLCQMGAIGRAEAGQKAEEIVGFYYSGAQVRKLYE